MSNLMLSENFGWSTQQSHTGNQSNSENPVEVVIQAATSS
jgi:hypothetical protein